MNLDETFALGDVAAIWRYPVKSLKGESLRSASVGELGLDGDRRRALILRTPERARSGKPYRGKEDERLHLLTDAADAQRAARERGLDLEVRSGGPFFDDAPVSLLVDQWVHALERLLGMPLDPRRFRPNFFLVAAQTVPEEAALCGARIELGAVTLRVQERTVRCVTPTYDIETGTPNPAVLSALAQHRDSVMGVYCSVERAGEVSVGATARVFPRERVPA